MTLKIVASTSRPARVDPRNRERRPPGRWGESLSRITAKTRMPSSAITAMKSCRKPTIPQRPTTGMAKPSSSRDP